MPEDLTASEALSGAAPLSFAVSGMTCAGCAGRVERALAALPGAASAEVNLALEQARVTPRPDAVITLAEAAEAVRRAGYAARERRVELALTGMTCANCARGIEKALNAAPGVIEASVNVATETASVRVIDGAVEPAALIAAVEARGYGASVAGDDAEAHAEAERAAARREKLELIGAALLTAPLAGQMILMWLGVMAHLPVWVEPILAAPVWLYFGRRFHLGAWKALKARTGNMDTLVSLGSSASFLYSLGLVITLGAGAAGHLYFEAAAVIVTLVMFGKWLESRAKASAAAALRALMALRPEEATVLRGGEEKTLPIAEVARGDVVVVKPGERIAVDGEIIRGETEVDESLVTGEPLPVLRRKGDSVIAGSVNGAGGIRVRAEAVGADGTVARIARMVAEAQTGKAPIQRLVDRVSAVFVPAVLVFSVLTLAGWLIAGASFDAAFNAAISVLVIACPCALGLATPAALVAGTGAAARAGVLIRDISTLERAGAVDTVVFDKTGTLTMGAPALEEIRPLTGLGEDELLALAAAAQAGSEHPLGRAVVAEAKARSQKIAPVESFRAEIGAGVEATLAGAVLRMGRPAFAAPEAAAEALDAARAMEAGGRTVVWLSRDGQALGLFALADALREDARQAVALLKDRGLRVAMLTGDNAASAARVGDALGLDDVRADLRPQDKASAVKAMAGEGRKVAMVGDGINDAPALAAAELGVAMGGGADAALATAGVALLRPRPTLVAAALSAAQATRAKIRQNLFWAFAYNAVCLPIAAAGLLDPGLAGAAMALSSVSVAGNALLLKRWRPEGESA